MNIIMKWIKEHPSSSLIRVDTWLWNRWRINVDLVRLADLYGAKEFLDERMKTKISSGTWKLYAAYKRLLPSLLGILSKTTQRGDTVVKFHLCDRYGPCEECENIREAIKTQKAQLDNTDPTLDLLFWWLPLFHHFLPPGVQNLISGSSFCPILRINQGINSGQPGYS